MSTPASHRNFKVEWRMQREPPPALIYPSARLSPTFQFEITITGVCTKEDSIWITDQLRKHITDQLYVRGGRHVQCHEPPNIERITLRGVTEDLMWIWSNRRIHPEYPPSPASPAAEPPRSKTPYTDDLWSIVREARRNAANAQDRKMYERLMGEEYLNQTWPSDGPWRDARDTRSTDGRQP